MRGTFCSTQNDKDSCVGVPDLKALDDFHDDSASSVAERLVRFCRDYGTDEAECWRCRPVTPAGLVALLVDSLYLRGLSWITNEVPSLLHSTNRVSQYTTSTTVNQNEFIQPELYVRPENDICYLDPVSRAVLGQVDQPCDCWQDDCHAYFAFLHCHIKESIGSNKWTLVADLKWQLDLLPEQ